MPRSSVIIPCSFTSPPRRTSPPLASSTGCCKRCSSLAGPNPPRTKTTRNRPTKRNCIVLCCKERPTRALGKIGTVTKVAGLGNCATILDRPAPLRGNQIVLTMKEFFSTASTFSLMESQKGEKNEDVSVPFESLTYYLGSDGKETLNDGIMQSNQGGSHGVYLTFKSTFVTANRRMEFPLISHARVADSVPEHIIGNLRVRVVAGSFGGVSTPLPLDRFILLDVRIRSGMEAMLELPGRYEAVLYVLEGVAVFGWPSTSPDSTAYIGEGHTLHLPGEERDDAVLKIRTHPWEDTRFLVLAEPGKH